MGRNGPAERLLTRFEREVRSAVADRDLVFLGFSGGLGSLLLAAVTPFPQASCKAVS
jgi:PP-loop superfamily ATP-utilizing enzyme